MKSVKKIISVLLASAMLLSLAGCKNDIDGETTVAATTVSQTTTAPGATTLPDTTAPSGTTTANTTAQTTASTATTAAQTTTAAPAGNLPTEKAAILAAYNKAANDTKSYTGDITVKKVDGTTSSIRTISFAPAKAVADPILPNDYPREKTASFLNGTDKANSADTLAKFLPPDKQTYLSNLTIEGVKEATCEKEGNGMKIVIKIVEEKGNELNYKAPHHGACMDTVNITAESIQPFTLNNANVTYPGGTLTASINDKGYLTKLDIQEPVEISGTFTWTLVKLDAVIDARWQQQFEFTYA